MTADPEPSPTRAPRWHRWIPCAVALAVLSVGPGCRTPRRGFPFVPQFSENPADPDHIESCYRILTDDDAGAERWQQALAYIALSDHVIYGDGMVLFPELEDGQTIHLAGESLRARTNRSVTELASLRIRELDDEDSPASVLCSMTLDLATWDLDGALPVVREQMARSLAQWLEADGWERRELADCIASYTVARRKANDADALDEYADWITGTTPRTASYESFAPVWAYPDSPAMSEVAETLFADSESSWLPLVCPDGNGCASYSFTSLFETPLVDLPLVRRQLLREFALDHVVGLFRVRNGTITVAPDFRRWHTEGYWLWSAGVDPKDPKRARLRRRGDVRYRDFLA